MNNEVVGSRYEFLLENLPTYFDIQSTWLRIFVSASRTGNSTFPVGRQSKKSSLMKQTSSRSKKCPTPNRDQQQNVIQSSTQSKLNQTRLTKITTVFLQSAASPVVWSQHGKKCRGLAVSAPLSCRVRSTASCRLYNWVHAPWASLPCP